MKTPIRVLMVNYKMQCAGIESFIMNTYRFIDRSQVQFDFLVHYMAPQFHDEEIRRLGGVIHRLSIREDNNFAKYLRDLSIFFKRNTEYRIVHGHMESFGPFYLAAARRAGVQVRIAHSHIAKSEPGLKGKAKLLLSRYFKHYATDLFACSDAAGTFMFGNNSDYTVYPNAIDVESFRYAPNVRKIARDRLRLPADAFVVGHVGRFNKQKNHAFVIETFAEIIKREPTAQLLLIGEGDLEDQIFEKASDLKLLGSIRFLGARSDVNTLYQAMDVFILPSLFEGLPVSGIEAQASGLKCVFSDTVTRQTTLTKNTQFLPLAAGAPTWAHEILRWKDNYLRRDTSEEVIGAGYDIRQQARILQNYYISCWRG